MGDTAAERRRAAGDRMRAEAKRQGLPPKSKDTAAYRSLAVLLHRDVVTASPVHPPAAGEAIRASRRSSAA